ncbi:MAG: Mov34/MPN/PAD-1 family protein [Actinomycetota bacterium]
MSSELRIPRDLADEIIKHCLAGVPNEACGLLASRDGRIVDVFTMTNASTSPVRYSLDPHEQFAAYKKIEGEGWELAAVFHSHTRTEAYPSPTDVRLAVEPVPHLIVSLAQEPPVLRAFLILKEDFRAEQGDVEEVPVIVEG